MRDNIDMIITILTQKYKTGCGRGMAMIDKVHLLSHLNMIIDWSKCEWPTKEEEVEVENLMGEKSTEKRQVPDTKFLGDIPELKPGNCFQVDGQIVAVDSEDRLVLIVSETGPTALKRLWEDMIEPEIDMNFYVSSVSDVRWEKSEKSSIPGDFEPVTIPYNIYKIWKDRFLKKSGVDDGDNLCLKMEIEDDDLIFPVDIYFLKWNVMVKKDDFMDEDHVREIVKRTMTWFYERY